MKPIYLEPDEEITSVIDKISALSDHRVAIVVPKNSTLFQSLINLKLLAKEAKQQDKDIAIVSTNRVGQRLAQQVGFTTYNSLGAVGPESAPKKDDVSAPKPTVQETPSAAVINGVKVNQYQPDVPVDVADHAPVTPTEAMEAVSAVETAATLSEQNNREGEDVPTEPVSGDIKEDTVPAEKMPFKPIEVKSDEKEPLKIEEGDHSEEAKSDSTKPAGELPPIVSRSIQMSAPREPFVVPWKSIIIAGVLALLLLVSLYFFLPKADVVLTLPAKAVHQTSDLVVTTQVATGQSQTISGNLLTSTQSDKKTITSTGKKDIGTKAAGSVTLYNKASSAPVNLPAGTILTANDKDFSLDKAATIPGASVSGGSVVPGQITDSVTATTAGDAYNVSNVQFSIKNQPALVYATGTTTGGTTKQVTVLAQSDVDNAVNDLKTSLLSKATDELKTKAAKQTVIDNSTWSTVTSQNVDQSIGAQVSSATLSMTLEADVIAFDQKVANNAVTAAASKDVKSIEELVVPANKPISLAFKSIADDKASMTITATLDGFIVQKIDKTAIAKTVAHKSKSSAISLLKSQYKATDVKISLHPSWWPGQLPFLSQAIKVEHGFSEKASTSAE